MTIIRGKSGKYLLSIIFALSLYVTQSFAQEQLTNLPLYTLRPRTGRLWLIRKIMFPEMS